MVNPNGVFGTNNTMPDQINLDGATVQGQINCTYTDLVHAFGNPIDDPTTFIWLIQFNDFTVAKVYGVKETELSVYWNIDGFNNMAFIRASGATQRSLKEAS
jgi:hypothetical protein